MNQTIARILKVNHAGEYGAIRIYRAQWLAAMLLYKDLVPFFEETLSHEKAHCRIFRDLMPARMARPCRLMFLWSAGGYTLGTVTALLGRNALMICTAAVESTVHAHMNDQIAYLANKDEEMRHAIHAIQQEELAHLSFAESRIQRPGSLAALINTMVRISTETVIWLSTWGDITRMKHDIAVQQT